MKNKKNFPNQLDKGKFLTYVYYKEQKNVTRNGTLKSTTKP